MDLSVHAGVLRRYWHLILGGFVLAAVLAVLSVARITSDAAVPGLEYRDPEVWQSSSTLLLTRAGFSEGRLTATTDPNRLGGLADLYAKLATSDPVMNRLRRGGRVEGVISARPLISSTQQLTPLLAISGQASSPGKSVRLTLRASDAFVDFVGDRQKAAGIPRGDRVQLKVVDRIQPAVLIKPRKKTLPVVVFLAMLSMAIGLVYILETARRRRETIRAVTVVPEKVPAKEPAMVPSAEPEPIAAATVVPEEVPAKEPAMVPAREPAMVPLEEPEPIGEPLPSRRWA